MFSSSPVLRLFEEKYHELKDEIHKARVLLDVLSMLNKEHLKPHLPKMHQVMIQQFLTIPIHPLCHISLYSMGSLHVNHNESMRRS